MTETRTNLTENHVGLTLETWLQEAGYALTARIPEDEWYFLVNAWIDCFDPSEWRNQRVARAGS